MLNRYWDMLRFSGRGMEEEVMFRLLGYSSVNGLQVTLE